MRWSKTLTTKSSKPPTSDIGLRNAPMLFSKKITTKADATTIPQPIDHLAEMRKAIDAATSAAQNAGVPARTIRDHREEQLSFWRQRALRAAEEANRTRDRVMRAALRSRRPDSCPLQTAPSSLP